MKHLQILEKPMNETNADIGDMSTLGDSLWWDTYRHGRGLINAGTISRVCYCNVCGI